MTQDVLARRNDALPVRQRSPVRRDIQGLRALAVGLVVLNHLWPEAVGGGYVGVDIFFVISGFLITRHLMGELDRTGRVDLGRFYARRARRLLPAALLVAMAGMAAAWLLLPFSRWASIAHETIASALYVENWLLAAKSVDYSAQHEAASTVQHYWSLSTEEQFYLLWPLLLLGVYVLARRLGRSPHAALGIAMSLLAAGGLAASIITTAAHPHEAYFVTYARIWEFAAGGTVAGLSTRSAPALMPGAPATMPRIPAAAWQWAGYGMLAMAALGFSPQTPFPGWAAVLPVAGTVLIIGSGPEAPRTPGSLLAARPIQYLGDISYSIYLWHWPLIILLPFIVSRPLGGTDKAAVVVLTLILAGLTKKFVEDPGRRRLLPAARPRRILWATAAMMGLCVALGLSLTAGATGAQTRETQRLQTLRSDQCFGAGSMEAGRDCPEAVGPPAAATVGQDQAPWFEDSSCAPSRAPFRSAGAPTLMECDFSHGSSASKNVWLVGDSHAEQWKAATYRLARERGWTVTESLMGGCPLVDVRRVALRQEPRRDRTEQDRCLAWSDELSRRLTADPPDAVIISAFADGETVEDGSNRPQREQYRDAVQRRMGAWTAAGIPLYFIRDTPRVPDPGGQGPHVPGPEMPDCLTFHRDEPVRCAAPRDEALPPDPLSEAAAALDAPDVHVLDFSDMFCDRSRCYAAIGGLHVYYDADHIARSFIDSLYPVFAERLARVLA